MTERLARWRVPLGFLMAIVAIVLARPTPLSVFAGSLVAGCGEAIRLWAAGHLEKSREVTRSGPYQFMRHPLYVGSSGIALGVVIASRSFWLAGLAALYMGLTISAAIRREEAFLRQTFGSAYDEYAAGRVDVRRQFSLSRAMRNREYRAVLGLAVAFVLLWMRARLG